LHLDGPSRTREFSRLQHYAQETMASRFSLVRLCARVATALVLTAAAAQAEPINLEWAANPEPGVLGYIVHVGTAPATYTASFDVGNQTSFTFPDAVAGKEYFFAVTAYSDPSLISDKSEEVAGFSNAPPFLKNPGQPVAKRLQPATLQLEGGDPYGEPVSYTATGLPPGLVLTASTGFISGTPLRAGYYPVTASASDGVLSASQSFVYVVARGTVKDTLPPDVQIVSPSSANSTTTDSTLTIAGQVLDDVGVTQMTWVNSLGGNGTIAVAGDWSASVALQTGANVITISATDAAGNVGTAVVTVTH
jgi:putative Ig domain-containing protein/glucodextranase-like protein